MRTLGIDLATRPEKTGLCLIDWQAGKAEVKELSAGWQDTALLGQIQDADKTGIDAPLGWPTKFVQAVFSHQADSPAWSLEEEGAEQRRSLALRETDKAVQTKTGKRPLSASSDLIALVAFRLARIEQELRNQGMLFSRDGSGKVCEVYPGAALLLWNVDHKGYKSKHGQRVRQGIIEQISSCLPGLSLDRAQQQAMTKNDDLLDAFLASLSARAASLGSSTAPPAKQKQAATKEGWIHLPTCSLAEIL